MTRTGPSHPPERASRRISRREFLKLAGLSLAGGLLAGCGVKHEHGWQSGEHWSTPTPAAVLEPVQTGPQTPPPPGFEHFMALSALLTGFDTLDSRLGQIYYETALADPQVGSGMAGLLEASGIPAGAAPADVEALQAAGLFDDEPRRRLADYIITLWYTGILAPPAGGADGSGEGEGAPAGGLPPTVATYVDALAWKAIHFTKPTTICAWFGVWAERPKGVF
ncbi:MAG: sugar dehydrogenase complex small subunit [Chloroflexota bacterium]